MKVVLAILLLVTGGVLAAQLERPIRAQREAAEYGKLNIHPDVRRELPQELAIGLLAGFRGLAADFLWIQGHGYWEHKEWLRMYRNMRATTILQPKSVLFWDSSSWHMAWNIGYATRIDPANRTKAEGLKREREWQEKAQKFLEEGIANNPNRYDLYFSLGWLYWKKLHDDCQAANYFQQASQFADAPSYTLRMYARALEQCGDREGVYAFWKKLWRNGNPEPFHDGISAHTVIRRELRRWEELLNVPIEERLIRDPLPPPNGRPS